MRISESRYPVGRLSDVIKKLHAGVSVNCEDRIPKSNEIGVLKTSAVTMGKLLVSESKVVVHPEEIRRVSVSPKSDRVLICRKNTPDLVGSSVFVENDLPGLFLPDLVWQAEPVGKSVSMRWLHNILNLAEVRHQIRALSSGSSPSMANISQEDFLLVKIPIPEFGIQKAIAGYLEKCDVSIHYVQELFNGLRKRRQGLMQQLLTGKRRFPGFTKPWRKRTIGDVAEASSVRNNGRLGSEFVRAVNKAEGMIPMKEHVMADDLSRYQVVKKHWFAYNPMRINIGSICQWMGKEDALVSPDYVVFRCRDAVIDHRYLNAFRRSDAWSSFMDTAGAGGVRIRIYFDDLAQLPIPLPELDEQRRIADMFDVVDREIEMLERLLTAYRTQKQGLMQQLLTGKRRVKVQAASEAPP